MITIKKAISWPSIQKLKPIIFPSLVLFYSFAIVAGANYCNCAFSVFYIIQILTATPGAMETLCDGWNSAGC